MTRPVRLLTALAAGLVLAVVAVGMPAALWTLTGWLAGGSAGNAADLAGLQRLLTRPDDGTLVLLVLVAVGWVGWATFAVALVAELIARARGGTAPSIPGLRLQQRVVGALVAAVLLAGTPMAAQATTAAPAAPQRRATVESPAPAPADLPLLAPDGQFARPPAATALAQALAAAPVQLAPVEVPVAEGDTLWRLAETHLGIGMRWQELAAANYGRLQPDGLSLDAGHVLQPGWRLVLPAVADPSIGTDVGGTDAGRTDAGGTDAGGSDAGDGTYTVVAGDTLSSIAADELGDADRYAELTEATAGLIQPDGRQLTDPDLIYPGWTVAIPTVSTDPSVTAPSPPGPAVTAPPTSAPEPPAATAPPVATAPAPDVGPAPGIDLPATAPTTTEADIGPARAGDGLEDADTAAPVRTAAGIGALLAAAFLAMLALRRSRQRAQRRPGHRIALPTEPRTQAVEAQLREVAVAARPAALAAALADLAIACRVTGEALPRLRAARLEPETVELYLAVPATLPAPWVAIGDDSTIWTRSLPAPTTAGDQPDPLAGDPVPAPPLAPYPTLVTIGHDTASSLLLLNLDELGVLAVTGPDRVPAETQAAMAAELAGSSWSADVLVTVLDADPALCAALPGGRIRSGSADRLLVDLRARAAATADALRQAGADRVAAARHAGAGDDPGLDEGDWEFEVVLALAPLPEQTERELVALAGSGHGISVVLSREGPVAAPDRPPVEDAMWLEHRAPDDSGEPTAMLHPGEVPLVPQRLGVDALHALLDAIAHTAQPSSVAVPTVVTLPTGPSTPTWEIEATADNESEREPEPAAPLVLAGPGARATAAAGPPRLRLLGHVEVERATGPEPGTHTARTVALIAVLATHRQGRTRDQLAQALSPNNRLADGTLHALVSRARRWLGTAEDGRSYLPRVGVSGSAVYRLDPEVGTDWDAWRSLVGPEPSRARMESLVEALDLVRDAPLAGVVERHYTWAEAIREEMIASIVDVAHAVATRSLARQDFTPARRAIQAGRRADPTSEMLWRDALRVESAAGSHGAVASLVGHIQQWSDDSGLDLDPATEALMVQLGSERPRAPSPQAVGRQ